MGILAWIVLGLIAGAIAKAIMPGADPGGIIVTIIIGIVGAFIGGFPLTKRFGLTPGFDVYDDQMPEMRGAIEVSSQPGRGSRFTLVMPRIVPAPQSSLPQSPVAANTVTPAATVNSIAWSIIA